MKKPANAPLFSVEDRDGVRFLRFLHHHTLAGPDLVRIGELWRFFEAQQRQPSKVLVIEYPRDLLTPDNLDAFWAAALSSEAQKRTEDLSVLASLYLLREETAVCRFIREVQDLDSFVICVLQGEIDLPFLGPALACDYRIAAQDTVFASRCLDVGIPPCGALPWFLSRYLGRGMAEKILLASSSISAQEAYDLHLVNQVAPLAELDQHVLDRATSFAAKSTTALIATKRAMRAAEASLDDYLTTEAGLFERCIHDHDFPDGKPDVLPVRG